MTDCVLSLLNKIKMEKTNEHRWIDLENKALYGNYEEKLRISESLADYHCAQSERILVEMLKDKERIIRASACDSLCFSDSLNVFNHLIRMTSDTTVLVRGYAILSLGDVYCNMVSTENTFSNLNCLVMKMFDKEQSEWLKICIARTAYLIGNLNFLYYLIDSINSKFYKNRCLAVNLLKDLELSPEDKLKLISLLKRRQNIEKVYAVSECIKSYLETTERNDLK